MSFEFKHFAASVKAGAPITDRDTLALRQWSWADGTLSKPEAEALFDLNRVGKSRSPEWIDCFVAAISEFVVDVLAPHGAVSDENALWLMNHINKMGKVESLGEMELLVTILEKASSVPPSLKAFALAQIEQIVSSGRGSTRFLGALRPNAIDPIEVVLLRRILCAQSNKGIINAEEAQMLFRLKEATLLHDNAPGWQDLFVRSIGRYVMDSDDSLPFSIKPEFAALLTDVRAGYEDTAALQERIDVNTQIDPLERGVLSFVLREA
jgi:hypothetical protein